MLHDPKCECAACALRRATRSAAEAIEVPSSPDDNALLAAAQWAEQGMCGASDQGLGGKRRGEERTVATTPTGSSQAKKKANRVKSDSDDE
eukprot:11495690-Karenia_brevis.AAC.1